MKRHSFHNSVFIMEVLVSFSLQSILTRFRIIMFCENHQIIKNYVTGVSQYKWKDKFIWLGEQSDRISNIERASRCLNHIQRTFCQQNNVCIKLIKKFGINKSFIIFRSVEAGIVTGLCDTRSQVVRECCVTIAYISQQLQLHNLVSSFFSMDM